jgi:hypothetical protein
MLILSRAATKLPEVQVGAFGSRCSIRAVERDHGRDQREWRPVLVRSKLLFDGPAGDLVDSGAVVEGYASDDTEDVETVRNFRVRAGGCP